MKISVEEWRQACEHYFADVGISQADACTIVDAAITADMRGVRSHGTVRLPVYKQRLELGLINKNPNIVIENDCKTLIHLNGDNGLGQVVTNYATEMAIRRTKEYGSCIVSISNSNHIGMLAYYALKAAKNNLLSYIMCNTPPFVAPYGGMEKAIGTNPMCWSVPGLDFPIVMDMAISTARGKIRDAAAKGEKIPDGWAIDKYGMPTNDAKAAMEGSLLPVGGVKGYGMGLIVELFSAVLSGANYGANVTAPFEDMERSPNLGVFIMMLDIERIMPVASFKERVADYVRMVKSTKKAPGHSEIFIPGERAWACQKKAEAEGLDIDERTIKIIQSK